MQNLPHHLWIAICVSILSIWSSYPVFAKPQSKVIATSHLSKKVSIPNEISPPPVEAVLASLKLNPSFQAKSVRSGSPNSSPVKDNRDRADRFSQGISTFTNTDPSTNVSPVDHLTK
ncbi:hypothetical protein [Chamaesiphon sp. VAR_48_metabat_135_sub]|uniref:hypothetical protein n=1 Tax=Chamaesiphon sp. VAR_48_metabat_135_sub TaxID=2964699 RepID=UPI00286C1CD9|nr:hypothetical protein [Chamaesiphon sp. VAR_48_metabat_135_sub]